jgi:hypothetical protein
MESGGFPGLQNQCDLTASGRVGSIPIHSRQHLPYSLGVATPLLRAWFFSALTLVIGLAALAGSAAGQRPDTNRVRRVTPAGPTADTIKPPISPRRAFLYSALLPGYGQAILGRNKAAAVMLAVEAMAIAMIRESGADVREARRMSGDTVVISYVDASGNTSATPATVARRFDPQYVHARQSHVEDWVAFLFANHLFSGADAFVAANLWELPAQLSVRVTPDGASVGAKLTW